MKFGFYSAKQKKEQQEKSILFVCIENAGRSQMAEGFFNQMYGDIPFAAPWWAWLMR